jgi:hypothetical protein
LHSTWHGNAPVDQTKYSRSSLAWLPDRRLLRM